MNRGIVVSRFLIIPIAWILAAAGCDGSSREIDQLQAVKYFFPTYGSSATSYFLTAEYTSVDDDARQLRGLYRSCVSDNCYVGAWTREDSYTMQLIERFCDPPAIERRGKLVVLLHEPGLAEELPKCVPMIVDSVD